MKSLDINYFGTLIDTLKEENGTKNFKFFNYKFWYCNNEAIEFSKGNRDYIIDYNAAKNYKNAITVLSKYYTKEMINDKTSIITDYDFDLSYDEQWKKYIWICIKDVTSTQLVTMTNRKPKILYPFWHIIQWLYRIRDELSYYISIILTKYDRYIFSHTA